MSYLVFNASVKVWPQSYLKEHLQI